MSTLARWTFAATTAAILAAAPTCFGADREQSGDGTLSVEAKGAEGWVEVAPGVFERRLGTRVEHLGYGAQGLAWTVGQMRAQLAFLEGEQRVRPSDDTAQVIAELNENIGRARGSLSAMSSSGASVNGPSCGSICYGATADAYYLTARQGVAAVAGASFGNACGYAGETYAYAFARATLNGNTATATQSHPNSGTSISSSASVSLDGGSVAGIPCYSAAQSYSQSSGLGIYYTTQDINDSICPPPPVNLSVAISGTAYEYFTLANCRTRTWTSLVSGGNGLYSYTWRRNGSVVGSGSSYTGSVCYYDSSITLTLNVSDSAGASGSATHYVTADYDPGTGCLLGLIPIPCP